MNSVGLHRHKEDGQRTTTRYRKIRHPENNNIEAKIRQQLQFLRDKGFIQFLSPGQYKKN